jgi:nicotinamidase-related amidase
VGSGVAVGAGHHFGAEDGKGAFGLFEKSCQEGSVTEATVKTLLLVDLQNDFLPGGALAVPEGEQVIPVANRLMPHFDLVVATKDWHPADHGSFASQHPGRQVGDVVQLDGLEQILWPDHCIQGSAGADFSDLRQDLVRLLQSIRDRHTAAS